MAWIRNYLAGWIDTTTFSGCLLIAAIIGSLFIGVLVAGAFLFRVREIQVLIERINPKSH
jgi:type III secretory pathway component EscU